MISNFDKFLLEKLIQNLLENNINEQNNSKNINILDKINSYIDKISNKKTAMFSIIKKFNKTNDITLKKILMTTFVVMYLGNFAMNNSRWSKTENEQEIENITTLITQKAIDSQGITIGDVENIVDNYKNTKKDIVSISNIEMINKVNKINPNRLSIKDSARYDKYDDVIISSLTELKNKGENINPNLIKVIMLMETGMNPRKNSSGFHGFPQTKKHIIKWVNKLNNTNFNIADMYDAGKSAQFIHYYIKSISRSKYIKNVDDILLSYNWGVNNLGKYKNGEKKDIPTESKDYVNIYNVIKPYFDVS